MKNHIRFVSIVLLSQQINAQDNNNNDCMSLDTETCSGCLAAADGDCKWTAGSCQSMCLMDAPCFQLREDDDTPQSVCAVVDALKLDKETCTGQTNYDDCVATMLPSDESIACKFYSNGDGTGYCTNVCELYIGFREFRPPESVPDVSPGTDIGQEGSSPAEDCMLLETCSECLSVDCKWTGGSCQSMCLMDASCFELRGEDENETPESVCAAVDASKLRPIPEGAVRIPEETGWISPDAPLTDVPEGAELDAPLTDIPEGAMPDAPLTDIREGAELDAPLTDIPEGAMPDAPLTDIPEGAMPDAPLTDIPEGAVPVPEASPDAPADDTAVPEVSPGPPADNSTVPVISRESPGINSNMKMAMENLRSSSSEDTTGVTDALLVEDENSGSTTRTLIIAATVLGLALVIISV